MTGQYDLWKRGVSDWTSLYGDDLVAHLRHLAGTTAGSEEVAHALLRAIQEIQHLQVKTS